MKYFFLILFLIVLIGCNNLFFNYNDYSNKLDNNIQVQNKQLLNSGSINIFDNSIDIIGTKVIKENFVDYENILDNKILSGSDDINSVAENNNINIDIQKTKQLTQSASDLIELIKDDISIDAINVIYDDKKNILDIELKNDFKDMLNNIIEMYFVLKSNEIKNIEVDNNFQKEILNGIIKVYKIDTKPIFNSQKLANIKIYLDKDLKKLEIVSIIYVIKKDYNIIKKQNKDIVIK